MLSDSVNLSAGAFDPELKKWVLINSAQESVERDTLTLATFNIWFGDYFAEERYEAIANLLERHQPDFIALQEVTFDALSVFLRQDWIRKEYISSDIDGSMLGDYGVLILSRLPLRAIKLNTLPSYMGRHLLLVEANVNESILQIGTVHLESLKSSAEMRAYQLMAIFESLKDTSNAVIMGDFNFCASWKAENKNIDPAYQDVWGLLRGDEPGYTEDTSINRMRYLIKQKHKQVRFDRILLKSLDQDTGWKASTIDLLGTEPISPEHPNVFPSDHFGLLCRISRR